MRQRTFLIVLAALLPLAFFAGRFVHRDTDDPGVSGDRKVLYWVDPMNPAFRSPAPGTAPCGMPLEPVYADGPAPGAGDAPLPGAVPVSANRLQLIGVARETVRRGVSRHTLRMVGTVAADETHLYRIAAATEGRIREVGPATTGSLVGGGEILAAYYSQEAWVPQQNYIRLLETYRMLKKTGSNPHDNMQGGNQLATYEMNLMATRQTLMNLGMTPEQIEEIGTHGQPASLVQIRTPSAGFITARNVSFGQSFVAGEELYTIADLGRVWILADAFEGQEDFFKPGTAAVVTQTGSGRRYPAIVSAVPPRFDPATRTLKVRLEAANPGFLLRPDMFVDVELPVAFGPGIFLPKEAVLDSGTHRIVFVEQDKGVFAPRVVRAGRRLGGQVEIVAGLMEGETVVTSGNFLLDSESRMRAASAAARGEAPIDPICGMEVEEGKARAAGLVSDHGGRVWFFCNPNCKQTFDRDPQAAAKKALGTTEPLPLSPPSAHEGTHGGGLGARAGEAPDGMPDHPLPVVAVPEPPARATPPARPMQDASFKRDWALKGQRMPDTVDPVCGMQVQEASALAEGLVSEHGGRTWFFCTAECKQAFEKDPDIYVQSSR